MEIQAPGISGSERVFGARLLVAATNYGGLFTRFGGRSRSCRGGEGDGNPIALLKRTQRCTGN